MANTIITAHSGAEFTKPNSLSFIQKALSYHANAVELDIRRFNGELIISHNKPKGKYTRLEDAFLSLQNKGVFINCDLKHGGLMLEVEKLAENYHLQNQILFTGAVESENIMKLMAAKAFLNLEGCLHTSNSVDSEYYNEIKAIAIKSKDLGYYGVNIDYHDVNQQVLDLLKQLNIPVIVWTVNRKKALQFFLSNDVYSITTNRPIRALNIKKC